MVGGREDGERRREKEKTETKIVRDRQRERTVPPKLLQSRYYGMLLSACVQQLCGQVTVGRLGVVFGHT